MSRGTYTKTVCVEHAQFLISWSVRTTTTPTVAVALLGTAGIGSRKRKEVCIPLQKSWIRHCTALKYNKPTIFPGSLFFVPYACNFYDHFIIVEK